MNILFFILGLLIGIVLTIICSHSKIKHGTIDVDEKTGLCRVRIESNYLSNQKIKKAVFKVNHKVTIPISRDEQ